MGTQNSSEVGLSSTKLEQMVDPCQVPSSALYFPGGRALSRAGIWEQRLMPGLERYVLIMGKLGESKL